MCLKRPILFSLLLLFFISDGTNSMAKTYTRSCKAKYRIEPVIRPHNSIETEWFTGKGTVGYFNPNLARERARKNLEECIDTHWRNRTENNRPRECTEANKVFNYPFNNLQRELRELTRRRFCTSVDPRYRGYMVWHGTPYDHVIVNVWAFVTGDTGCFGHVNAPWVLARDYRFNCLPPATLKQIPELQPVEPRN